MMRKLRKVISILEELQKTHTCSRCGHELPEEHFEYNGSTGGYYGNKWCMACNYTYNTIYNKFGKKECKRIKETLNRAKARIARNRLKKERR